MFHPLFKFRGPKAQAATDLTNTYYILIGTRVYHVAKPHDKYDPVVRLALNELSYIDKEAWKSIYTVKAASSRNTSVQTPKVFTVSSPRQARSNMHQCTRKSVPRSVRRPIVSVGVSRRLTPPP